MKQIIVMRKDLGMRAGKMVSQGAHASLGCTIRNWWRPSVWKWIFSGPFTKITVRVESESELMEVYYNARRAGLATVLITDAGKTEFNGVPTRTCIAVGPATDEKLKNITGDLRLL